MHDLIEAAKAGDTERARQVLAATPAAAAPPNEAGETAVMAALYRGHRELADEIADAILSSGGQLDVFAAASLGRTGDLDAALTTAGAVNAYAYDGWTPLHLAAFFGEREAAGRLLAAGAPIDAVSANSLANTPLHAPPAPRNSPPTPPARGAPGGPPPRRPWVGRGPGPRGGEKSPRPPPPPPPR